MRTSILAFYLLSICWYSCNQSVSGQNVTQARIASGDSQVVITKSHLAAGLDAESGSAGVRAFFLLPSGYTGLKAAESGVVLLRKGDNYYKWQFGEIDFLMTHAIEWTDGHVSSINWDVSAPGDIVINPQKWWFSPAFQRIKESLHVWRESGVEQNYLPRTFNYTVRDDIYFNWQNVSDRAISLLSIDDAGRIWQESPYQTYYAGFYGGSTNRKLKSLSRALSERGEPPFIFVGSDRYKVYSVSRAGVPIGETGSGSGTTYYIGTKAVDFRPISINLHSMVLGNSAGDQDPATIVWWPDGRTEATPSDGYPLWLDDQGRIHGYKAPRHITPQESVVWQPRLDTLGEPIIPTVYDRFDYETLELPEGWTTDLKIPPDDTQAHLGTAIPNGGGAPREFVSLLLKMDLAVDADRSGTEFDPGIQFGGADQTSEDEPYLFWVNNDRDSGSDDEAQDNIPIYGQEDYWSGAIFNSRGMEDLSRIWIDVDGIAEQLKDGSLRLGLEWKNATGDPKIKLYKAVEVDGGMKYLFDENAADLQKELANRSAIQFNTGNYGGPPDEFFVNKNEPVYFETSFWDDLPGDGIEHFLFEGAGEGKGELVFVLQSATGGAYQDIEVSMSGVWFDLKDIKKMYQHFTVATPDNTFMGEEEIDPASMATEINGVTKVELDEMLLEDDYILYVHGWRMKAWERRGFAETAYKRLYWQGYKGRFGMFSWPTEWIPRLWWLFDNPDISEPRNFSKSERKGMLSANGLRGVLNTLSGQYTSSNVHMFAHSLGNVVSSEALRLQYENSGPGDLVNTYIACQSATAAHSYDANGPEVIETDGSTSTPEIYRDYPIGNQPYFINIGSTAGTIVNFHNHQDGAMVGWLLGQKMKQFDPLWYYDEGDNAWYRNDSVFGEIIGISDTQLFIQANRYEIFAHIAEARSTSLGAAVYGDGEFSVNGSINDDFDLNSDFSSTDLNYGNAQEDHSAQFRSTNMRRSEFYRTLMDFMGL